MKNSLRLKSKSGAGSAARGTASGGTRSFARAVAGGSATDAARYFPRHVAGGATRDTSKEAAGDKEQTLNKSAYYSRYYSPLDYFLERASRWVLGFAFLYMLAQIIRVVIR